MTHLISDGLHGLKHCQPRALGTHQGILNAYQHNVPLFLRFLLLRLCCSLVCASKPRIMAATQHSASAADLSTFQPPESAVVIGEVIESPGETSTQRTELMDDNDITAFAMTTGALTRSLSRSVELRSPGQTLGQVATSSAWPRTHQQSNQTLCQIRLLPQHGSVLGAGTQKALKCPIPSKITI